MKYYIDAANNYYTTTIEEDKKDPADIEVSERPDPSCTWDGDQWSAPIPVVPQAVTMRQARIALNRAGLLSAVNAAIAALPAGEHGEGDEARITWEFASEIQRDGPLIGQLAPGLGLTDTAIDNLFIEAATL